MTRYKGHRSGTIRHTEWDDRRSGWYFVTICTEDRHPFFGQVRNGIVGVSAAGCIAAQEWRRRRGMGATTTISGCTPIHWAPSCANTYPCAPNASGGMGGPISNGNPGSTTGLFGIVAHSRRSGGTFDIIPRGDPTVSPTVGPSTLTAASRPPSPWRCAHASPAGTSSPPPRADA